MELSKKKCPDCGEENERNYLICATCSTSMGFPNVNVFADPIYTEAINQRYNKIIDELNKKGILDLVQEFEHKIETEGKAVIAMNFNFFCITYESE